MNDGFPFDIILLAMLAAFILLRLRSVLGRRTGHERRPPNPLARRQSDETADKVIRLPDADAAARANGEDFADVGDSALAAGLTQIKLADQNFTRKAFLEGARAAFEDIIGAYAAGDTKALRPLLADDVYDPFARAIGEREKAGHSLETVVVSMDESEIIEAGMNGRTAFVTVRFVTNQVNVTRDSEGNVVDGDPGESLEVTDVWTFERNTRSRNPNWKLVATRSPS
ncbi:MAG: Tim44/TimA family putative adaptor protein [Alphaproteobacteria bacterium]